MIKDFLYIAGGMLLVACSQQEVKEEPASTIVNADGSVTFNYRNDGAKEVMVDVQFAGRHAMQKDSVSGMWSVTLGPADPDMYPYNFVVDGISIMDPKNPNYFPNEGFKGSILDMPGKEGPLVHAVQNVPHGNVEYVNYYSNAIGCYNSALVYTPASYAESDKQYPVFYLISGTTDTEEVYYKVGRMNTIADNLIAQGKAAEMIIVLPYGNPMKAMQQAPATRFIGDVFSQDLVNDLMPYIENHYRTINDADHRAIGGFSRGGNQALSNGLLNLDKFSYLCSYSSFTSTELPKVYDNAAETNAKINLFWLGIGTDDFLFKTSHDYLEFLDQKGIRHCMEFTTGKFGHTWMNAKYFLSHTLPLLFNKEASAKVMQNGIEPIAPLKGDEQPFTPGVMARLFPRPIISPEFAGDSVTFRIKAPQAHDVRLEAEFLDVPQPMQRDSDGVWFVTLTNITPDIYLYNFVVDGTQVMDPVNMYLAPETGFKRSICEFPGAGYALQSGAAQSIQYTPVRILTDAAGVQTAVIAPAGVDASSRQICLLSGDGYTFQAWQQIAHAQLILDQLIASGQSSPATLYLVAGNTPLPGMDAVLNIKDFTSWSQARETLVSLLLKK